MNQANATPLQSTPNAEAQRPSYVEYAQQKSQKPVLKDFAFVDPKMVQIYEIIQQVANTNVPVFLCGESGVGKEVVARATHRLSDRRDKPFVAINCAAIPSTLLEGELFGFEKGSFTGANQRHIGKFEQAEGGTLLLDEVTEMDPATQVKILRVLQEKEIERVGGLGPVPIDVRIIATTNRDLKQIILNGSFREDLYYRLNVIHVDIPALRDRPKDIDLLAHHFLQQASQSIGKIGVTFSQRALEKLRRHRWPGNVRELHNTIHRAVLLSKGLEITENDIPMDPYIEPKSKDWVSSLPLGRTLREVETNFILSTLNHHKGNRTHAARTLGISLRTLRNKINEFLAEGLEVPAPVIGKSLV